MWNGIDVLIIKEELDMEKIKNIWFDNNRIYMRTRTNKIYSRPLEAYPELMDATTEQRNDYVIGDDGEDIRWETLDADMHISSFLETSEPKENEIGKLFAKYPWLNISEVARSLNINKSLLARYIYGISKPSEKRVAEIKDALHRFGKELLSA